jgi:tripartite-type tricarboxylate transporter receptor subunit TctC
MAGLMKFAGFLRACCIAAILASPALHAAEAYPARTIRLILPFGASEILYQLLTRSLSETLGQPVVIDYKPGSGGHIGAEAAAKSPPDGYTLIILSSAHTNGPSMYANLKYDVLRDFAPISLVARVPQVLVVHPALPAKNLGELAQLVKANPNKFMYGSGGVGSSGHLAMELFKSLTRSEVVHIPYKGGASVLPNILSGEVHMLSVTVPPALSYITTGKLRALAVLSPERAATLSAVPSAAEAGMPDLLYTSWYGAAAPAGADSAIVQQLQAAIAGGMNTPDMKSRLAVAGVEPITSTPAEFAQFLRSEVAKWAVIIKNANIRF